MSLQRVRDYQGKFFLTDWTDNYQKEHSNSLDALFERTSFLLEDKIIFTDAMDMEACAVPYSLKEYAWNHFPEDDPEWLFMLSRQGFLVDLAIAYRLTKKACYLEKWHELFLAFITCEGKPVKENENVWRVIDVGIRVNNWMRSLTYIPVDILEDLQIEKQLKTSLKIHLKHIEYQFIDKYRLSNWGVLSLGGMAVAQMFFPDLLSEEQKIWLWEMLEEQLDLQFYKDGVHWEQSPLYQHEVIITYLYILQVSEYLGEVLPINLRDKLKQPIQAVYYQADGKDILNPINDSDQVDFYFVYDFYRRLGLLRDGKRESSAVKLWTGSLYKPTIEVSSNSKMPTVFVGEDSGFMAFKNQDIYFTLFNGLHGSSHGHSTTGSFTLQMQGEDIIIDSGRFSYVNNDWRLELKADKAHNTIFEAYSSNMTVSGTWSYEKLPVPLFHRIKEIPEGFFAECGWLDESVNGNNIFERSFLYIEAIETFVIVDSMVANQRSKLTSTYNLSQEIVCEQKDEHLLLKGKKEQFSIIFPEGKMLQETSYYSKIYNQMMEHQRLIHHSLIKNNCLQMTVISRGTEVQIQPVKIRQNNKILAFSRAKGLRIMLGKKRVDVFALREDIVSGDKLLVSEFGQYFYGRIVIFDQDGKRKRIK